ncbi:MAG: helix-turn-helix domain-containing protein [Betaproteobacteria bacterium]|nr:helix-turn-helix domain-containing protein [Betaproteobacteria bacterium]
MIVGPTISTGESGRTVARVCRLVDALTRPDCAPKSLSEIHESLAQDVPKATLLRLLRHLQANGWVRFDERAKVWALDARITAIAVRLDRYLTARGSQLDEEIGRLRNSRSGR